MTDEHSDVTEADLANGFIRIPDPDVPIYRIYPLWFLEEALRLRQLVLVPPRLWDDPYEILGQRIAVNEWKGDRWSQEFPTQSLPEAYAQCWSATEESDTLLRAYSRVVKHPHFNRNTCPGDEGVRVRTTPRRLLTALIAGTRNAPKGSCFLGSVMYLSEKAVQQDIANGIGKHGKHMFAVPANRAKLLLLKRTAFAHEAEVRLVYVRHEVEPTVPLLRIPINPNDLFDQIAFDPRLVEFERKEREAVMRDLGFAGEIERSQLYLGALLAVVLGGPHKQT